MSDKKYKVKIVKVAIGDPLVAFAYYFESAEGNFTDPTVHPITEIDLRINISGGGMNSGIGHININKISTLEQGNCMMPFDDSGYANDISYTTSVVFDATGCDFEFDMPAPWNMPDGWVFTDNGDSSFSIDMTSGFNNAELETALRDAGWLGTN
ncbi:MAG: hypothetical protein H6581_12655 [Bacteroidia bacterium]|nr:hypothetical protein [Bacteroidia bacterium]